MDDNWCVVKRRRNSNWLHCLNDNLSESLARAGAASLNECNDDIRYYYRAEQQEPDSEKDEALPASNNS